MSLDPIEHLILELGRLPGVGVRSAARLAFYIIAESRKYPVEQSLAYDLAKALTEVADKVVLCKTCHNLATSIQCNICSDARRDEHLLCIVEGVEDLRAIEACGSYRGFYHVLHGSLAPLDGIGPKDLFLDELYERVQREKFQEVIIATNADVEGDATALYIGQLLRSTKVRLSRLAAGIPLGGELEFIDQATLGRALAERREF
ncbi:MAG: recombination protein RecR [Deltaproteobacteria bacterium]|nr:recombination protein RecR [Deltaproteobacteria bacterium]